ncbi:MAG: MFS transporter, partial [Acidimicrobiaceae bacterium]|nr:MFS transporter [Acidimicrobiaceae bacterium]
MPVSWPRALAAAVTPYIACSMPIFLTATMAIRLKEDLGIGEEALGALLSIFSVGAAIAAPIMGRLAERLGPGPSLRLASTLSGAVMISIATAAEGWLAIAGLLVAGGIAATLMQSSSNLWLARTIEDRRMGLAFGMKQSGGPAAALLAGVAVPVLALAVGGRGTFAAFGGFALAAVLTVPRTGLRGGGRTAPGRAGGGKPRARVAGHAGGAAPAPPHCFRPKPRPIRRSSIVRASHRFDDDCMRVAAIPPATRRP